jgi:hypothetical protein
MTRVNLVLAILLAASAVVNVVIATRSGEARVTTTSATIPVEASRATADRAAAEEQPCAVKLTAARAQIASGTRELDRHLPYPERFAKGRRATDHEAMLSNELARVWAGAPRELTWELACHGDVCTIDLDDASDHGFDWMAKLQADITPGLTHGMMFTAFDPDTNKALGHERVYVDLAQPGDFPGDELLERIVRRFEVNDAEEDCAAKDKTPGVLTIDLTVDPVARTIDVAPSGSLAGTRAASCLLDALAALIARDPVPLNSTAATRHVTIPMPPRDAQ